MVEVVLEKSLLYINAPEKVCVKLFLLDSKLLLIISEDVNQ